MTWHEKPHPLTGKARRHSEVKQKNILSSKTNIQPRVQFTTPDDIERIDKQDRVQYKEENRVNRQELANSINKIADKPEFISYTIYKLPYGLKNKYAYSLLSRKYRHSIFIADFNKNNLNNISGWNYFNEIEKEHPEMKNNDKFQNLKNKLRNLSLDDIVERVLMHEKGHHEIYDALNIDNTKNLHIKLMEVTNKYRSHETVPIKNIPQYINEMVAEDYRRIYANGNAKLLPNTYTTEVDILYPEKEKERLEILKDIFNFKVK